MELNDIKKSFKKPKGKSHLDKDFLEELKHKIWSTRGSRFQAADRLNAKNKYSLLSTSFLSAYLIIFGLLSVYDLYNISKVSDNIIPFTITSLSIFLLIFTLFENSKNYTKRAIDYHNCALELARLYNELQCFKSYNAECEKEDKKSFSMNIQNRYQSILEQYDNHLQIDNKIFKLQHLDYYDHIKWHNVVYIKISYFIQTYFWYIVSIFTPAIFLVYILLKLN
ncbi:SLATT domain-containing protein [Marinifilum fragile]|uniref:SLATT domain-containing protein n=1 Tax=Marinifilum fragile TaxID=570161 RepID=UPI003899134D